MPRKLKPCGTRAAYQRHLLHGEQPCDECKAANSAAARPGNRVKMRALKRLARRHPGEFAALLAEERANDEGS